MILDSVTLDNFGLYAGRQEIALTPPSVDRPVVLFGGPERWWQDDAA